MTLPQNFQTPFLREYFLCMGAVTSAKETFRSVLKKTSTALIVVVGGVIPHADIPDLHKVGVDLVFGPGSRITDCALQILEKLEALS